MCGVQILPFGLDMVRGLVVGGIFFMRAFERTMVAIVPESETANLGEIINGMA